VLGPEQFQDGCLTEKSSRVRINEDKSIQKKSGLVYDPRELLGVMTGRPGVAGVLQMVSEPTLGVSRVRTRQLRRI
jgi:hypothetical protein